LTESGFLCVNFGRNGFIKSAPAVYLNLLLAKFGGKIGLLELEAADFQQIVLRAVA
jgi:hypothetical protein